MAHTSAVEMLDPTRCPSWLPHLLRGRYFSSCARHAVGHKAERNYFCIACCGDSLCSACAAEGHSGQGHEILQVRRSSYHEAIRVNELSKLLDLSHIQVYVINSAKIVFLNGRPQARPVKGAPYYCQTCERMLLDASRFCSIGCKLAALPQDPSVSFAPRVAGLVAAVPHAHASHAPPVKRSPASSHRPAGDVNDNARLEQEEAHVSHGWTQKARSGWRKRSYATAVGVAAAEGNSAGSHGVTVAAEVLHCNGPSLVADSAFSDHHGESSVDSEGDDRKAAAGVEDDEGGGTFTSAAAFSTDAKRFRMDKFPPLVPISSSLPLEDASPSTFPRRHMVSTPTFLILASNRRRKGVPTRSPMV